MSKSFIAAVLQDSVGCTGVDAKKAATALVAAIVGELQRDGRFSLPRFGTFVVRETKTTSRCNPRTGAPVADKTGRTVRFRASPPLKKSV